MKRTALQPSNESSSSGPDSPQPGSEGTGAGAPASSCAQMVKRTCNGAEYVARGYPQVMRTGQAVRAHGLCARRPTRTTRHNEERPAPDRAARKTAG